MSKSRLESWFAVAITGKFPQGDLTVDLFDQLVSNFAPADHEPPLTTGHITQDHNDKPAMGWTSGLKRVGNTLYAKAKQVWADFDQMVKDGRYKKRSIAVRYRDDGLPYLHHIAFLGSQPPAVKGLPDIYQAGAYQAQAYQENDEKTQQTFETDPATEAGPTTTKKDGKKMEFTEQDVKLREEKAAADAKAQAEKDYNEKLDAEKTKAVNEAAAKIEQQYKEKAEADRKTAGHRADVDKYIDEAVKAGKITPAQLNKGLRAVLYGMAPEAELVFSDADKKEVKTTLYAAIQEIINAGGSVSTDSLDDTKEHANDYAAETELTEKIYKEAAGAKTYGQAMVEARQQLKTK